LNIRSRPTLSLLARFAILLTFGAPCVRAQISPAEILNPRLKALEQAYLKQLVAANQAIAKMEFPFTFCLSRYAGLDPKDQAAADRRGLEFVKFHESLVLKATGNYNAAFSGDLLTANQRASRVFDEIVAPVLAQLTDRFAPGEGFDAFGLEISYHVMTKTRNYHYEGGELLTLVMNKDDAVNFKHLQGASRQEVLNRAEVYLDGKPLGLVLGERDPMPVEALERSTGKRNASGASAQSKSFDVQSPISVEPSGSVTADSELLAKMRDYRPLLNRGAVGTEPDGSHELGMCSVPTAAPAQPRSLQSSTLIAFRTSISPGWTRYSSKRRLTIWWNTLRRHSLSTAIGSIFNLRCATRPPLIKTLLPSTSERRKALIYSWRCGSSLSSRSWATAPTPRAWTLPSWTTWFQKEATRPRPWNTSSRSGEPGNSSPQR